MKTINRIFQGKTALYLLVINVFLLTSCIKNDIPYPVIPMQILSFEVEGQNGSAVIDNENRTVTVDLNETINLKQVKVKRCTVTEGITSPLDSTSIIDLSTPKNYTLTLYQDYVWTIQATQTIERRFSVEKQIGQSIFNNSQHQVVAYISNSASQKNVTIKELKLGPEGITTMEPELTGTIDFSHPQKVTISYHDITEEWTVMVSRSDKDIATGTADAWVNVAWLHGSGQEGADNGFEIRESSQSEWQRIDKANITGDAEFTARVSGLKSNTTYMFRAYSGEDYGDEVSFTTGSPVALPNGSFDDWHQEGKVWNPWAADGTPVWDTGNDGAVKAGNSNSYPTTDTWQGNPNGYAARLETIFANIFGIGKLASGNIFIGKYLRTDGTDGVLEFGYPFNSFPTRLKGYYKYTTSPINYIPNSNNTSDYNRFRSYLGQPDTCSIYIALVDYEDPIIIQTKTSNRQLFDKNDEHVIAYAELNNGATITEYTEFNLELQYRATNRKPTYIIIVCSASKYGDYFTGGTGAVLTVDEFSLEYDY